MADIVKSFLTWVVGTAFILLMFPVTVLLWLFSWPAGISSTVVHYWVSFQGRVLIRAIPIWKVSLEGGRKKLEGPYVIISNHQSLLDIPLLSLLNCNYRWVSKIEIFKVPILGLTMRMAGYIPLERGNLVSIERMMAKAESLIKRGISVIIFPEGTRSKTGIAGKFKSGAFRIAASAGVPILPVIIDGTYRILPKKGLVFTSGHPVKMKILEPVTQDVTGTSDPDSLAKWFEDLVKRELDSLRSL